MIKYSIHIKWVWILIMLSAILSKPLFAQDLSEINNRIDKYLLEIAVKEQFQGVILVAKEGEVLYKNSIGYANHETKKLNSLETKFRIGSLTKSFTAVTAMQFVEDGLLDLNIPIEEYLPDLNPSIGSQLTLHQLLKMQSGLPNHLASLTNLEYKDITNKELIEIINTATLSFDPGSDYGYSNINFTLVALILERVSGKSYSDILQERIFTPLKMTNSGVERTNDNIPKIAIGYDRLEDGSFKISERNYMAYAIGSGDIYSNVGDLYLWDQALSNHKLLSDSSTTLLFTNDQSEELGHYGYGFRVHDYVRFTTDQPRGKLIRHGGSMQGYLSNYHKYLDDELTIIVLGNIRPYAVMDITTSIKEIVFGREAIPRNEMKYRY